MYAESENEIDPESTHFLSINVLSLIWVSIQMELSEEIPYIFTKIQNWSKTNSFLKSQTDYYDFFSTTSNM